MKVGRAANKRLQMEEKIFEAGMSLFQEKGFKNTTLQEICEKAGVSKGTIFNYFSSKEDILAKYGRNSLKRLRIFAKNLPPSMNTKEKIIAVLMEDIRGVKESEVFAKVALKGIAEGGELISKLEGKNRQELSSIYESILINEIKSSTDSHEINTALIADLIVAIYFHVLESQYVTENSIFDCEEYIKSAVDMFFNGIKDHFN